MDKRDFDRIVIDKQKRRDALDDFNSDVSVFVYACLIAKKPLSEILKGIDDMIRETGLRHTASIRARTASFARKAYKQSSVPTKDHGGLAASVMTKESALKPLEKAEAEWLRDEETAQKDAVLREALKEPADTSDLDSLMCFSLASRHDDCAKDHEPYQGKLYVKEWALKHKEIKDYCEKHGIKTVEWVTGKPAWLTTRPNCRHFFKDLTWKEVRSTSVKTLLKEYGADRVAGSKGAWQNIKHKTRKEWYTQQNVLATIKKYEKRLKKHEEMAEIYENENLRNEILKDKSLIRKWKSYYAEKFGK